MSSWTVSFQTGRTGLCVIALLFSALAPAIARCETVQEAQAGLSKAYNSYYEALEKLGTPSPADVSRLNKQLLEPAQRSLGAAVRNQTGETIKNSKGTKPPLYAIHEGKPGEVIDTDAEPSGRPIAAPAPAVESKPETVLDGSAIPKEIEFPGPKPVTKKKPSPLPGVR